jgi:hypothetical protein
MSERKVTSKIVGTFREYVAAMMARESQGEDDKK